MTTRVSPKYPSSCPDCYADEECDRTYCPHPHQAGVRTLTPDEVEALIREDLPRTCVRCGAESSEGMCLRCETAESEMM